MNQTETITEYHQRTKHHPKRYARSLGYMDWATQPDPFREYYSTERITLPLSFENPTPNYSDVMGGAALPEAPLSIESLSQLLQFSLGIAAWKCLGNDCWALRCNASSGNLQPTEATMILPPVKGISEKSIIAHYHVKSHSLEILAEFETRYWQEKQVTGCYVLFTSIPWREMWKYGERAFRYVNLDLGHALQAVTVSAQGLGWSASAVDLTLAQLQRLGGLDQPQRYHDDEKELPQTLLYLGKISQKHSIEQLLNTLPHKFQGHANLLSPSHHPWEAVELAIRATQEPIPHLELNHTPQRHRLKNDRPLKEIILKRRSAQAMDFARTHISFEQFEQLLHSGFQAVDTKKTPVSLLLFVHDVERVEKGLYFYVPNPKHLAALKRLSRKEFLWREQTAHLYLLEKGDFRSQAKFISCSQDIAGDGAFSLGMITQFDEPIKRDGAAAYKTLYWECGRLGQQLYLEATALGLSATGIGCYLDDVMHRMLGFQESSYQTLYHFTVGRAILGTRMSMRRPYSR